ncbi:hypothetical protein COO09_01320 [Rhizorhabdus dicambivorans]|uniref:PilZ domain-containing protein n=2 Tax=Rhizorhabdus dicambivorans TaxID=1850238 RepID=A0A2A4G122_9SPHN|nr:hypothetical protein CMV14_11935 [Rhizorhabdus dicambivorans]PCE44435.1 hypothetical protein COO09_01320 [Rhizorhabdus dicambivorans]
MASRWRRRTVCDLISDEGCRTVALRGIDGRGARLDSDDPPALGSRVELRHPDAGTIQATVSEIGRGMLRISFDGTEAAIAFALAAIASDMTRGR